MSPELCVGIVCQEGMSTLMKTRLEGKKPLGWKAQPRACLSGAPDKLGPLSSVEAAHGDVSIAPGPQCPQQ